jgi:hypothetical protein
MWIKKGFIYGPTGELSWAKNTALTPTPFRLSEDVIRVYCGFRDAQGVSRIGFVDVDAANPKNVISVSTEPVLDVGIPGAFDDNGVILGDVIRVNDEVRMYYVGFQKVEKAKFLAFTGLAISKDNGATFIRYSNAPVLDRTNESLYIRAIHSVVFINGVYHIWYASGNGWEIINGVPYPQYRIRHLVSKDGLSFGDEGPICIDVENLEYRIGRPRVFVIDDVFYMHYTRGTTDGQYLAGLAKSFDGKNWVRMDDDLGIELSETGWDSIHLCYPAVLDFDKNKKYMFYNGNNMGFDGFGYAEFVCQ